MLLAQDRAHHHQAPWGLQSTSLFRKREGYFSLRRPTPGITLTHPSPIKGLLQNSFDADSLTMDQGGWDVGEIWGSVQFC